MNSAQGSTPGVISRLSPGHRISSRLLSRFACNSNNRQDVLLAYAVELLLGYRLLPVASRQHQHCRDREHDPPHGHESFLRVARSLVAVTVPRYPVVRYETRWQ